MSTFPASPAPSQSSSAAVKPRLNKVQFGDGYSTRVAEGLNSTPTNYNLTWRSIIETDRATLDSFLRAAKGATAFDWVTPAGATIKVTCDDWGWTYGEYNLVDFRATFQQVYEV